MHEEKIQRTDAQVQSACSAIARRSIQEAYFTACGGSLATLYPGYYLLGKQTALAVGLQNAAEFVQEPPVRLGAHSLVVLNSQSGSTPETVAAAKLARERGALTVAFTTAPESAIGQAVDQVITYYDDPLHPFPAVLTIFPEVYKLTFGLQDLLCGTARLPEVNAAMLRLQATFDAACEQFRPSARDFARQMREEPLLYTVASGLDSCVGYIMTNCLIMESVWRHSSPLHAGEFFHGAFEAVDGSTAVLALLGLGPARQTEERAVKFLLRKTKKLTVIDAAATDLSAYPDWLRPAVATLVLNRLCALYCDEWCYALGHPVSSRRYMGVEKY